MFGLSQGDSIVMLRSLWRCRRMTAQYPYDLTGTERKPNARAVRLLQERTISLSFLPSKTVRFLHNQRAGIVRIHLRHFYGLTILHKSSETKRLLGALESVRKSHGRRLPPHGDHTVMGIRAAHGLGGLIAGQMFIRHTVANLPNEDDNTQGLH